jgi:hypothetical protein
MKETIVQLSNTIWWNRYDDEKVDVDSLRIVFDALPFATRQVCLRFAAGPDLDLSLFDMDRIAVGYLEMRGVDLPSEVQDLKKAKCPPPCDFLIPKEVASLLIRSSSPETVNEKRCARCLQTCQYSGDWYGDLCPQCADETEPDDQSADD